jgi:hypothetical protein
MDRDHFLLVLEGYGAGPNMRRLICHFWDKAQMVCHMLGNYRVPFKAGHGVTQGGPLSAKLFNLVMDAVARKWLVRLPLEGARDHGEQYLDELMQGFLAIFCVDDASRDPVLLQIALSISVKFLSMLALKPIA